MNEKATKAPLAPIPCKGCGVEFTPKRLNQLYHDDLCRDRCKKQQRYDTKRAALLERHEQRCALPCADEGKLYKHVVDGEEMLLCGYHRSRLLGRPRALLPKESDLWNEDVASVEAINKQMQQVNAKDAHCKLIRAWDHALWIFREKLITDVSLAVRNDVLHLSLEQDGDKIGGKLRRSAAGALRQTSGYYYEGGFDAVDERLSATGETFDIVVFDDRVFFEVSGCWMTPEEFVAYLEGLRAVQEAA